MCVNHWKDCGIFVSLGAFAVEIQIGTRVGRFDVWAGSDRVVANIDINIQEIDGIVESYFICEFEDRLLFEKILEIDQMVDVWCDYEYIVNVVAIHGGLIKFAISKSATKKL